MIAKSWAKLAGHQLHPNSWQVTLQAKTAVEHEKKNMRRIFRSTTKLATAIARPLPGRNVDGCGKLVDN
jgi:hypothetical protein